MFPLESLILGNVLKIIDCQILTSVAINGKARHYENMPMQYTEIFKVVKNEKFQQKFFNIFLIFAQNIDCFL